MSILLNVKWTVSWIWTKLLLTDKNNCCENSLLPVNFYED